MITADHGHGEHDVTFTGIGVPPTVTTTGLPAATQSAPYATTLTASGGTASYRWSLTSGALPYRLSLDAATGTITGTPVAAGTYSFVVKAVGSGGFSGSATLAITVVRTPETLNSATVGMASTPDGNGYWITDTVGEVRTDGDAGFYGSMAGRQLNVPIAHIIATADAHGYWLVASDGAPCLRDAPFYGSMAGYPLNKPIVDIAPTPNGRGYWLVASDGGIFAFGDAIFRGSMGGTPLNEPVVGMAPNPVTGGYWLVASDGGIFGFDRVVLRIDRFPLTQQTGERHGRRSWWSRLLVGCLRRRASSPSAVPVFHGSTGGTRACRLRWSAWPPML